MRRMEIKQKCFIAYAYIFMALHKYKKIMRKKIEQAHGNSPNLPRNLRPTSKDETLSRASF